jgi:restriction endonuclease S subunit
VAIAGTELATNQGFKNLLPSDRCLPKYGAFVIASMKDQLEARATGGTFKEISKADFGQLEIPLPPLAEQARIVNKLEAFAAILEGAQTVVENWKPEIQVDPSWSMSPLGEICDVRDGTHESPKFLNEGIPFITSKNLRDWKIDFSTAKYISENDHLQFSKRSSVNSGDILMGMIGTIGNAVLVEKDRDFSVKNVALIKTAQDSAILNKFLLYLLHSSFTQFNLFDKKKGATQSFIGLGDLRSFQIPLPSIEEQAQIVEAIEQEHRVIQSLQVLISTYTELIEKEINRLFEE